MMNFGKSRARMMLPDDKKVTFQNVAGLQEEKEDLVEVVDFLKAPQKYTNAVSYTHLLGMCSSVWYRTKS